MNYFYTVPKIELEKYPLKSNTLAVLDFLCQNKTTRSTTIQIKARFIELEKNQYAISERKLANQLKMTRRAIQRAIERLVTVEAITKEAIYHKKERVTTLFTIPLKSKKGTTKIKEIKLKQTEVKPKKVPLTEKKVPLKKVEPPKKTVLKQMIDSVKKLEPKESENTVSFCEGNKYNSNEDNSMNIEPKSELEKLSSITESFREDFGKKEENQEPENKKRYHHVNQDKKYISKTHVLSTHELSIFRNMSLGVKELLDEYKKLMLEYKEATQSKKIQPEYWLREISKGNTPEWMSAEYLCAIRGYFTFQKNKRQSIDYFKSWDKVIACVVEPSLRKEGYDEKLERRRVFLESYTDSGYEYYNKSIVPKKQLEEAKKKIEAENQKKEDNHNRTKKYWVMLVDTNPIEAEKIAQKADSVLAKCIGSGWMQLSPNLAKKKGDSPMRFAAIEAALEKDAEHASRIMLGLAPIPEAKKEEVVADRK
jgi:hypothetical protein